MLKVRDLIDALKQEGLITEGGIEKKTHEFSRWDAVNYTCVSGKGPELSLSEETFGSKSFVFFRCWSHAGADAAADVVRDLGGKPNFNWCPDYPNFFSVRIRKIKGYHWWE